MEKLVRVELGDHGLPIRIFRKDKKWLQCPEGKLHKMRKADAVGIIRLLVFSRSGGSVCEGETVMRGKCEECEHPITWESFEMHEKMFKGRGGEVSLENCLGLCHDCHQGSPNSKHGDRRWQTAKVG